MRHEIFTKDEIALVKAKLPEVIQLFKDNVRKFSQYDKPLLLVGPQYPGIWLEHNQDNIFLADYLPEDAWSSQTVFVDFQREDGLIPFVIPYKTGEGTFFKSDACFWQIQSVYPLSQCALDIATKTNRPVQDLEPIYNAVAKYDAWLMKYRNVAKTGLVEMFCEYDTGHDNDPRVTDGGIPHSCPGNDAANMPDLPCMPIQSVDLSAMLYGSRVAMAKIAKLLGKHDEAKKWEQAAKDIQAKINELLYDPEDNFYYDLSPQGLRKYKTEHITRLFLNKVLTQEQFDSIYDQYFTVPSKHFNPNYPIPAVSVNDPHFVKECPHNSWGSNSQANTALRAILWMDYYKRAGELDALLAIWLKAFIKNDFNFAQELHPHLGTPGGGLGNYSPSLIIFIEAAKRLGFA